MYTTQQFEEAVIKKGYELEHICYTPQMKVDYAFGFVYQNKKRTKVHWDNRGFANKANGGAPLSEFNLFSISCIDQAIEHANHANGAE